uniref:Ras association domain family member 1 n=1 Tax=Gopherus evgoodei TaxID=1825980 RepID=A0A8C4Y549_9SAUR
MIELKNLELEKRIDLTREPRGTPERPVRLERTNALRITPGKVPELLSRGHAFRPCTRGQQTWCDLCGDFVWGGPRKSLQCAREYHSRAHCKFTCHYRCRALIRLDCSGPRYQDSDPAEANEQTVEKDTNVSPFHVATPFFLPTPRLCPAHSLSGSASSQNKDGSYTGFIKVQLKLIPCGDAPLRPSTCPRTRFKHLHIISRTRASEVIEALLKKFMVVDNPRKFALFERAEKDDQVYLRKLSDEEQPLHLRLLAGPSDKVLSFVLKENETGEVNWDAFSMPELHNFLRILQREEEEHVRQILHKYARCRQKMQEALTTPHPGLSHPVPDLTLQPTPGG